MNLNPIVAPQTALVRPENIGEGLNLPLPISQDLSDFNFSRTASLIKSDVDVYSGCLDLYLSILRIRGSGRETVRYPFGISYVKSNPYLMELHYTSRTYSRKDFILRYIYINYDGKWRSEKGAGLQVSFAS